MDTATKRRLGDELEPGLRSPAPAHLRLVQRFLNTWNHEFPAEWDRLRTGRTATRWLKTVGLLPRGERLSDREAKRLRVARQALRGIVEGTGSELEQAARLLDDAVRVCVQINVSPDGRTRLEPSGDGVAAVLASLLIRIQEGQLTGTWVRLKGCRQCGWAFYDQSKNRSGAWCSMSICGNRSKNRSYRRRNSRVSMPSSMEDE